LFTVAHSDTIKMAFDEVTRAVLEHYTDHPPRSEDAWYGPWTSILTTLFPSARGYIVTPQQRLPLETRRHIPDFFIEVVKLSTAPLTFRTVLIIEMKNTQYWQSGIQRLQDQINEQCDSAFSGTAHTKLYWIGTIGPHWRYGEQVDDGEGPIPLINWHDTIHDEASLNDLQVLADLIHAMCVFIFLLRDPILMLIHDAGDLVCLTLESKLARS